MIMFSRSYSLWKYRGMGTSGKLLTGTGRFKAMALVSTPVSCRKAFVRVDCAASKDHSLKEVGIFSINLNSEAFSS